MLRMHFASLLTLALLLGGCQSGPLKGISLPHPFQNKAEQSLSDGVRQYEDGNYQEAQKSLQSALNQGLANKRDEVKAHKYLAFIHCASGREKSCREEFRKALDLNPAFDLTPAEAGHPVWGPVFRGVKAASR